MRTGLAEKLLVKIMNWSTAEIRTERPLLQALSNFKYDEYQQFSLGTRFMESLVKWLNQFENFAERKTAYDFIKKHLIFLSNNQMLHLVNITFADKINPQLIKKTAGELGIKPYNIKTIVESNEYKEILRKSLFIGLSDGSRIDQLRRASSLNNEQVIPMYSISQDKSNDILKELGKDGYTGKFESIFLIDDFTASGTSYFREENGSWKGKIFKTLDSLFDEEGDLNALIAKDKTINIHIIFYVATIEAIEKLNSNISTWLSGSSHNMIYTIEAVQYLDSTIKENVLKEIDFIELSKKYFDDGIVNEHYKKGKCDEPYLGFNECGLPLILVHNTPNNSLPILWLPEDKKFTGLFPRVSRHK